MEQEHDKVKFEELFEDAVNHWSRNETDSVIDLKENNHSYFMKDNERITENKIKIEERLLKKGNEYLQKKLKKEKIKQIEEMKECTFKPKISKSKKKKKEQLNRLNEKVKKVKKPNNTMKSFKIREILESLANDDYAVEIRNNIDNQNYFWNKNDFEDESNQSMKRIYEDTESEKIFNSSRYFKEESSVKDQYDKNHINNLSEIKQFSVINKVEDPNSLKVNSFQNEIEQSKQMISHINISQSNSIKNIFSHIPKPKKKKFIDRRTKNFKSYIKHKPINEHNYHKPKINHLPSNYKQIQQNISIKLQLKEKTKEIENILKGTKYNP